MDFTYGSAALVTFIADAVIDSPTPRRRPPLEGMAKRAACFFAAVARWANCPVGQAAARRRGATDWMDSRPVRDMMVLGATPQQAVEAYDAAMSGGMWTRGYGSPYSLPAAIPLTLIEWGKGPGTPEWEEALNRLLPVWGCRDKYFMSAYVCRRDGRLHPDWRVRLGDWRATRHLAETCQARNGDWRASVAARRHIRRLRACGYPDDRARLIGVAWATGHPDAHTWSMWRLRQAASTPRAGWYSLGIAPPPGRLHENPVGLQVKALKALIASAWDGETNADNLDYAVRALRTWGPLANHMVAAMGLHDAAQTGGATTSPRWEAYRDLHTRWIRSNPHRALRLPLEVERQGEGDILPPESLLAAWAVRERPGRAQEWLQLAAQVDRSTIPAVQVAKGGLTLRTLDRLDPLAFGLGEATHCCMHVGGQAETCLRHGITSPDGCFWVVENTQGTVIAQSWVWRSRAHVVVDNVEAARTSGSELARLLPLYQAAAQSLLGRLGITVVLVGAGYSDIDLPLPRAQATPAPPQGVYTDTWPGCHLLAEVEP